MVLDVEAPDPCPMGTTVTSKGKVQAPPRISRGPAPRARSALISQLQIDAQDTAIHAARWPPRSQLSHDAAIHRSRSLHFSAPGLPIDQVEQLYPLSAWNCPPAPNWLEHSHPPSPCRSKLLEIQHHLIDIGSRIQGLNLFKRRRYADPSIRTTVNSSPQITALTSSMPTASDRCRHRQKCTVAPSGALNFKIVATLNLNNAVGAVTNQAMLSGLVGGFAPQCQPAPSNTNRGIPHHRRQPPISIRAQEQFSMS